MKESRKQLIKDLHSKVGTVWQTSIEKEFPKLFKEDALIVGKWYKYPDFENWKILITDNTKGKEKAVGFNCSGNWMKDWLTTGGAELIRLIPCLDEEVEQALIKEAKKRGFKKGCEYIGTRDFGREKATKYIDLWACNSAIDMGRDYVFLDGKWAEIVTETITKEQAEKELGKTILN
jgi:hypothetical protein